MKPRTKDPIIRKTVKDSSSEPREQRAQADAEEQTMFVLRYPGKNFKKRDSTDGKVEFRNVMRI